MPSLNSYPIANFAAPVDYLTTLIGGLVRRVPMSGIYDPRFERKLESYGAVLNGTTDDRASIQTALDSLSTGGLSNGPKRACYFPPGSVANIGNPGLSYDASKLILHGNGSTLRANGMTSGFALTVTGSQASPGPYGQQCGGIRDLHITGHNLGDTTALANVGGILFDSAGTGTGTRAQYSGLFVRGFATGINFRRHSYLHTFHAPEVAYCTTGWYMQDAEDAGESVTIIGGITYNGGLGFRCDNPFGHLNLFGHSIDYNQRYLEVVGGGMICAYGCNLETNSDSEDQIYIDGTGASFLMSGGRLLNTGPGARTHLATVNVGQMDHHSFVAIENVWINNLQNAANRFARGPGRVMVRQPFFWFGALSNNPTVIGAGEIAGEDLNNSVRDGSFESGTLAIPTTQVIDEIFIYQDGAAITSRYDGLNGDIGVSSSFARTGGQSLQLRKNTTTGNVFTVMAAIPMTRRAAYGGEVFIRGDGAVTGTYDMSVYFGKLKINDLGVPVPGYLQSFQNITGLTPGVVFTQRTFGLETHWHAAATHLVVVFNLTALGIGSLYVDDFSVSEW